MWHECALTLTLATLACCQNLQQPYYPFYLPRPQNNDYNYVRPSSYANAPAAYDNSEQPKKSGYEYLLQQLYNADDGTEYNANGDEDLEDGTEYTGNANEDLDERSFWEELTSLGRGLQQEMEPLNNDYGNLVTSFFSSLRDYGSQVYDRFKLLNEQAEQRENQAYEEAGGSAGAPSPLSSIQEEIGNALFGQSVQDSAKDMRVQQAFTRSEIVPDLIDQSPIALADVAFPDGTKVNLGNDIAPARTRSPPSIVSWPTEPGALYTLVMTDPHPDGEGEWHHWLLVNIPGTDLRRADTITEYVPSGPPPKSGKHRYTFLVYRQPGRISDPEHGYINNRANDGRGEFHTRTFAMKHALGKPIAGNYYLAECDNYVPVVYAQLGLPNPGPC